ncbi:Reverse transcriptase [Tenacibaculum sp. 190524A05c]|uniref:RNA-directed DNA polymerase n=1 Tax=Tenacibaculum platacis TaxID=3137852 RepID=UPI0031FB983E
MNIEKILEKGYFPKELPPGFYTKKLAEKISVIKSTWNNYYTDQTTKNQNESNRDFKSRKNLFIKKYSSSKSCEYSLSKGKLSRRILKIPNPKHFIKLSELINNEWNEIESFYKISNYSNSFPIEETNIQNRSVRTFSKNVQSLRDKIIEKSINKLVQVKVDISKFYPTIYTHTISWSLLGKSKAKEYYAKTKTEIDSLIASGDSDAKLYKYADELDSAIRACQDKQSIGIPIGPDTSHIISEIITCRIDKEFETMFNHLNVECCRYYDDYYFYVNTQDEADIVIKGILKILNKYQLEINDKKVKIEEYPFSFENKWVTDLHRFEFKQTNFSNSLKHYFSLVWGIGKDNKSKTDWIFKYSLRTFEFGAIKIPQNNWKTFENLLIKTALFQPAILDVLTRIFLSYKSYINSDSKEKIKDLIESVINIHSPVNHSFEISWALWLAKSFEIKIEKEIADKIIETKDPCSILILLCIDKTHNNVNGTPNYTLIENDLKDNILFSESWILAYQACKNGWLTPTEARLIENNEYFKILKNYDVDFFDCSRQLKPYFIIEEKPENAGLDEVLKNILSQLDSKIESEKTEEEETFFDISNLF